MKKLFAGLVRKSANMWNSVIMSHMKMCILAGAVTVTGTAAVVTGVEYVNHRNDNNLVQAHETEQETETSTYSNLDKLNKIISETKTEAESETEAKPDEEVAQIIQEAVADENTSSQELYEIIEVAVENSSAPIPVKDVEDLEIVEDNSQEPSREEVEVEEPESETTTSSNEIYEVSQLVYGIDVSRWQGDIDWSQVAADGISFAMIKCGGGDDGLYEDRKFKQNIQGALANGIQVGVYFYSGAKDAKTAYDEASFCINLIKDYKITYPVAFDWELDGDYDSVTQACETFCNVVSSYGYNPMVYSNRNRWYNNFDGEKLSSKYKVWMACYWEEYRYTSTRWAYGDDLASFKWHYDMWQYGVTDSVAGIDGYVDMNIAFFGYANYHIDTQEAVITVKNKSLKRYYGTGAGKLSEELNLLDGVKGTNSIGYDMDVEYTFFDAAGMEYSEKDALSTEGKYTVRYSFKDPKSGWIYNTAQLQIIVVTEEFSGKDIVLEGNRLPKGFSFTDGITCKNNFGETAALEGFVVRKTDNSTGESVELTEEEARKETFDFDIYSYSIEYTFNVPKEGTVVKKVAVKGNKQEETRTESETQTEKETKTQAGTVRETTTGID